MKATSRAITMTLGAGILGAFFISNAVAGCGDLANLQGPFQFADPDVVAQMLAPRMEGITSGQRDSESSQRGGGSGASIVGMWNFQFISMGNTGHSPSIPDGAVLDFGYQHWHSDGTEFVESGGHPPAGANFCLGVWGQTGYLTYEINHFPIAYDTSTGNIANYINVREQLTLSPSGDRYSGTFTQDVYDTRGVHIDHVAGMVVATRITVDSTLPSSIPGKLTQ
ncbi:MAG TPA: hypothetical protein VG675_22480 [Bryobacteraceae bacterium]|nr:hypothetical protein [Bryobacteraceae bacterium]